MIKPVLKTVGLIAAMLLASGCTPPPAPPPASSSTLDSVANSPALSSDWRVHISDEDVHQAVNEMQQESPVAAEVDPSLRLPDWGLWGKMSNDQARELYKGIPLDLGLKFVYGTGKNELVIFSDPHNQNDRRLMGILLANAANMDATIYVFPLPSSPPISNVARIFCTASPEKAWAAWMKRVVPAKAELGQLYTSRLAEKEEVERWHQWEREFPEVLGCQGEARADSIDILASKLGVVFTPTVIFAHGRAWPGQFPEFSDIKATWAYVHGRLHIAKSER